MRVINKYLLIIVVSFSVLFSACQSKVATGGLDGISDVSTSASTTAAFFGSPSNLQATVVSGTSVKLDWVYPSNPNVNYFMISYSLDPNVPENSMATSNTYTIDSSPTMLITNLPTNNTYYFRVRAVNESANQYSPYSTIVSATIVTVVNTN